MINNHGATEIKNVSDYVGLLQRETCEFESINIVEIEASIKIHIPLHIPSNAPSKKARL